MLEIVPLSPIIGAEIRAIDLSAGVAASVATELRRALARHVALVFRRQRLSPDRLLAAVGALGQPERQNYSQFNHPEFPDIGILDYEAEQTPANMWHTDHTNRVAPPMATVLYAVAVPGHGGDTSIANMRAAYAALPATLQRELESLKTVNTFDGQFAVRANDRERFGTPVVHPLVRTHPETGEKALYFHILKAERIVGRTPQASRVFLQDLLDRAIEPAFVYRHRWQVGDVLVIDNRSAMHKVHDDYDRAEKRLLHRVIIAGDRPI